MSEPKSYRTFKEFYPFYLGEHTNRVSRRLHFAGTSIVPVLLVAAVAASTWWLAGPAFLQGYALAWCGISFSSITGPPPSGMPGSVSLPTGGCGGKF